MIRPSIAAAAFVAAATFPIAASAAPMTLPDAVTYALAHSPVVAQKYAAVATAAHSLAQARGNAFPTINGQLSNYMSKSSNFQGVYGIIGGSQQNIYSQNTAQIGTTYTLTTGGLSFLQLTAARANDAQAREDLANTENQVASTVTNAYYDVVQKRAIVSVDEADLSYQNVLAGVAKAKERAGVVAGVDVLKAEVAQNKSASTLVAARADVDNAREALAQAIGSPLDQHFVFPNAITQPPMPKQAVAQLERIALASRPDVKAANESLIAAQTTRKTWARELFPNVQLGASFGNQYSPTSFSGAYCNPANPSQCTVIPRGSPGFWSLSAQTTFTLPFVDYNQRHAERVSDDAQVQSAKLLLDQARTQVEVDVRQTYRAAQTALAQLAYAQQEAKLGRESARVATLQYQRGISTLADVIQTQQQSVIAQSDLVNARVAYIDAIVKLRVSLGIYDARSAVADL